VTGTIVKIKEFP